MRYGTILSSLAILTAAGCLPFPYDDYSERRVAVERPVQRQVELDENGKPKKVKIYLPQGTTNFYIERYNPYPAYYQPGYITYYDYPPTTGYYPYGGNRPYSYAGQQRTYYGGYLAPGYDGQPTTGSGGTRYYPGSGLTYGVGQSRPSYGIYGNGNGPQGGGTPKSRFSNYR